MSGIFGIVSKEGCVGDLIKGISYLQHRAQQYCGLAVYNKELLDKTHKGKIREPANEESFKKLRGWMGIGSVATDRQPISELSKFAFLLAFDGNVINYQELKNNLLAEGVSFSGYLNPEYVPDTRILSKIITKEKDIPSGIEAIVNSIQGDFSVLVLTKEGIYAARGWGRKPLILGKRDNAYAVSSESCAFDNLGLDIERDVKPGEIVLLNREGINTIEQMDLKPIKYGTFEWVYTANASSIIDGISVENVRNKIGELLAKRYPVEADIVSAIPNSGIGHAIGYARASGIPYGRVFVKYDYSDRSFTKIVQEDRDKEAKYKLLPVKKNIEGKRIVIVDDSIVRGTQSRGQINLLKQLGAKEVHLRIGSAPLMRACKYGKTTRKDEECAARCMPIEEIKKSLNADSLGYITFEDFEEAIGMPREKLCLECWEA